MPGEPRDLTGSVVAVTGAARGIGRATAEALMRKGARVAIGDVDLVQAERTARELGGDTLALDLDVTERASFSAFLDEAQARLGPLDALVNNAGIMPAGSFLDEDDETALRQVDINVHGVILGMKLALPGMLARGRGHLVNIASLAGKGGFPGVATYCATKHAVVGVTEALRNELRETPIEFTLVMPAFVNTELIAGAARPRGVRVAEPQDVAAAIVAALERPRFEVFVPPSAGRIYRAMTFVPRPAREAIGRALKADRVLTEIDWSRRDGYERRAALSERSRAEEPEPLSRAEEPEPVDQAG